MSKAGKGFIKYVKTGLELSDCIKKDITKDGCISNKTILKLNEFTIAYNEIAELTNKLTEDEENPNIKLN